MIQKQQIKKMYFEEGKNIKQISIATGHDRKTVRMYIDKDNWNEKEKIKQQEDVFPKLSKYKNDIDDWLNKDKKAKPKQRHTAKRVYDRLHEKYKNTFDCSYRSVAGYVAIKKKELFGKKSGHLPLEHIPGEAQVDFGSAEYYENGRLYSGKYLNLSFPSSNKGYFQLFKGENQECLFEGLVKIFYHIGGVPQRIWFDNASTMVTKILKNGGRILTDDFIRFSLHHRFEYAFCNAEAGHEKGSVEGKVGYHRRNMLVPVPQFENLLEYNKELLKLCEDDAQRDHYRKNFTIEELYERDKEALLELPKDSFDTSKYITIKTNDYGRFYLNSGLHEYSVSPKYANKRVFVKLSANEVIPMDENTKEIVRHERFYGEFKQQSMKWLPYLTQLARSPGALKYTGIYQMLPEAVKEYLEKQNKSDRGKVLQVIAELTNQNGFECAVESVENALLYNAQDIDSLLNLHSRLHRKVFTLPPIKLSNTVPALEPISSNLSNYDLKLGKVVLNNASK